MEMNLTWRTHLILSPKRYPLLWWRVVSSTALKSLGETGLKINPLSYLPKFRLASHMPEIADKSVLVL